MTNFKAVFSIILLLLFPNISQGKEIYAEGSYLMSAYETSSIAESRAFHVAKVNGIKETANLIKYDWLTNDEKLTLVFRSAETSIVDKKRKVTEKGIDFRIKIKLIILDEETSVKNARIIKESVLDVMYKELLSNFEKNQEQINNLRNEFEKIKSEQDEQKVRENIARIEEQFQSLVSIEGGFYDYLHEKYDDAIDKFNSSINKESNLIPAYLNRGFTYYLKSEYKPALEDWQKVTILEPDNFFAYLFIGNIYLNRGDYIIAIDYLTKAIEINPGIKIVHNNRGIAYKETGQYDKAINDATAEISINRYDSGAYYNRANALFMKKEYGPAIQDLTNAIELNPEKASYYGLRGASNYWLGNINIAKVDLEKACNMNDYQACDFLKINRPYMVDFHQAMEYVKHGEKNKAKELANKLIEENKNEAKIRGVALWGLMYMYEGQYEKALEKIEKIKPFIDEIEVMITEGKHILADREGAFYLLVKYITGSANYSLNNYDSALIDLLKYTEGIKDSNVFAMIADCYREKKDYQQALDF